MIAGTPSEQVPRRASGECEFANGRWSCWPDVVDTAFDVDDREFDIYTLASEHFRHDLTQFWNHSSFFALLQGALISVAVTNLGPQGEKQTPGVLDYQQMGGAIGAIGLLIALFWSMVAWRRSDLIQEWRKQVLHLDGRVNRHAMYQRVEPKVAGYWWYGPTKLTVALPLLFAAVWLLLLAALISTVLALVVFACELSVLVWIVFRGWREVQRVRRDIPTPA